VVSEFLKLKLFGKLIVEFHIILLDELYQFSVKSSWHEVDGGSSSDEPKGNIGVPLNKGTKDEETKAYVHSSTNDDKVSAGAAKFEAAAQDAGADKGLAFPLTKEAAAANMATLKAPLKEKE